MNPGDAEDLGAREVAGDVCKAVLIASLSALGTALVNWGIEKAKARAKKKPEEPEPDASR